MAQHILENEYLRVVIADEGAEHPRQHHHAAVEARKKHRTYQFSRKVNIQTIVNAAEDSRNQHCDKKHFRFKEMSPS